MQFCHPIRSGIAVSRTVTGRYWIKKERKKQTNKETNKQTNKQTKKQTNKDRNKKARNKQTNKAKKRGKERKTETKKETKRNKQRNKEGRKERKKETNKQRKQFPNTFSPVMFTRSGDAQKQIFSPRRSHFCCGHTFAAVTLLLRSHFCCGRQLLLVTANSDFIQQGWPSHSNLNNEPFTWPLIQFYLEKCQFFPFCPRSCVCDPPCKPLHPWQAQFSWGDLNYLGTTLGFIYISEHLTT